jgi:uncharacterized protein YcfL
VIQRAVARPQGGWLPAVCTLTLVMAAGAPAAAQISVEVSPLRVELKAAPGGATTQAITITNDSKEAVRVRARLSDWDLSRDGAPQFEGAVENGPYSATSWVRLAPPELIVDPGKQGIVRFNVAVPADVEPAGYRSSVLFEFAPASGDPIPRGNEVQVKSRIATLIYVNVGQPPAAIELTDLQVRPSEGQTQIVATLKNTSRRTVRTKGSLFMYDGAGAAIREVLVPDVPVLPDSERDVAIVAVDGSTPALPAGNYRVEVKIDAGMTELLVGETTLKVQK